ncbi:MAG TPA: BadF/BadG/BcrA/BcrD ATPase family protein [Vicinamibacteria bacterium]|nr:BadF/BadG/BcrA/BcrD ATPase family protein [Vicinamibacteria bacterium]
MSTADLLVAVDGGGTRTRAAVADLEGRVLARGFGPSSNLQEVGLDEVGKALTTAVEGALLQVPGAAWKGEGSAWKSGRIAAACFGLAGVDTREDEARLGGWLREQGMTARFSILNDAELVLACGTPDGTGVALISGTGSIGLGRAPDGRTARVGGWGPLMGDEGSGYQLALRALRLATQTADGRAEAPTLLRAALTHWSAPDAFALMHQIYAPATSPADIAGFAASVLDLGARGDAAAILLVEEVARELAVHVRVVIQKLKLTQPPLALGGGLLRSHLRNLVAVALAGEVGVTSHVTDPVVGAISLAQRLLKGR